MADPKQESKKPEANKVEVSTKRVKSKVNMLAKDGCRMEVGKHCELSAQEYERLKADKRHAVTPFWEE